MSDRPNALTVYVSDQQLAFLEEGARRMRALSAASGPEATPALAAMTSADMVAMLVEMAHKQYLNDQNA